MLASGKPTNVAVSRSQGLPRAQSLGWVFRSTKVPATAADIATEWDTVKAQPTPRVYTFYRGVTKLQLTRASMEKRVFQILGGNEAALEGQRCLQKLRPMAGGCTTRPTWVIVERRRSFDWQQSRYFERPGRLPCCLPEHGFRFSGHAVRDGVCADQRFDCETIGGSKESVPECGDGASGGVDGVLSAGHAVLGNDTALRSSSLPKCDLRPNPVQA